MYFKNHSVFSVFFVSLFFLACGPEIPEEIVAVQQDLPEVVDYNYHIKPILSDRCFICHGPDANQRQADYRLDLAETAFAKTNGENSIASTNLVANSLGKSEVFHRIISDEVEYMMPPPEVNLQLSAIEKALIAKWIEQGAVYKPHWSFVPPKKEALPKVRNQDWAEQPLDYFVLDKIESYGLAPNEQAAKATLLRRITLDLTGLPPTPGEIDEFLADNATDAYEKAIDRLLATPQFGERMAVDWLDVARYADSHGYQDDGLRNTWPWRDWVINSFNDNKPYDQFIVEQLAGDLLPNSTRDQKLATCFNRNHPQTQEGGVVAEEYRVEYVADRTNTVGKALMGLTMECARCHDHKYDPISQKDYYALSAFFNNNNDSGIVPYVGEATPTVMLPTPEEEKRLAEIRTKMQPIEAALVSENYKVDFKKWLNNRPIKPTLKEGLIAAFDFDKEAEISKKRLNLDGNKKAGWGGIGKEGTTISYLNRAKNKYDAAVFGNFDSRPQLVEGKNGKALSFRGDCGIRFNRDMDFDRDQAFSVSIWVKVLKEGEKGPIFLNANGDFEGYRGWGALLNEDGTLNFQLIHVWPDNAIIYKTKEKIKVNEWTHLTMVYDGSSKAEGLTFYVNGQRPDAELLVDNLQKSVLHGAKGKNWTGYPLVIGKENSSSIENIVMDEFLVYNRPLAEIEVQQLFDTEKIIEPTDDQLLDYYLVSGKNPVYNRQFKALAKLRKEENLLATDVLEVMVMSDRQDVRPTFVLDRGMYDARGEVVRPNTPTALANLPKDLPQNRLGLARWLTQKDHPLTARVQVNRLWMMLFGKGLVATQEDFGNQGNLPSHPELLDYLAVDFVENGWDTKAFIKKILLSATYQQSSVPSELAKTNDPTNDWYSYYPAHRLSAEVIRDNALVASGLLEQKIGGPSVYPYQPKGIWKALATRNATQYEQGQGKDLYRRSMYTIWKRSAPPPSMMNFDAPDRYYCTVSRQKTATPLQSLVLMNDPQYVEAARVLAERTMQLTETNQEQKIDFMFKSLVGRKPDVTEKTSLSNLFEEVKADFKKDKKAVKELLSIGEQPVNRQLDAVELSAYTMIASTVMNFDEFVMKR
ncbi:MAG: DUF1553 domain-containing protein [Bacteroidota bacterium]